MKNIVVLSLTALFVFCSVRVAAQNCKATFTIKSNICGLVTFQADNTSPGIKYKWYFGNGDTSNLAQPQHQYQSLGNGMATFTVKLVIKKSPPNPCADSTTQTINVQQVPDPSIADHVNLGFTRCENRTFSIDNASTTKATNTNYTINWGDGSPQYNAPTLPDDTEHTFPMLGDYTVVVTVKGQNGCTNSKTYYFYSEAKPNIGLVQVSNSVRCAEFSFGYNVVGISNNSSRTTYEFSVNDGTPVQYYTQATVPNIFNHNFVKSNCRFGLPNGFTLTVVAKNTCPSPPEATVKGIQVDEPPAVDFSVSPKATNCVGEVFNFKNMTQSGYFNINGMCDSVLSGYWTITPATGWTPEPGSDLTMLGDVSVKFSQSGTFKICLIAKNKGTSVCNPDTVCKTICVLPKPTSSFTFPNTTYCAPTSSTVTFANTSNTNLAGYCGTAKYTWEPIFDSSPCGSTGGFTYVNGSNANSQNITLRFDKSGIYKIKLTVENICGTNTSEQTITIAEGASSVIDTIPNFCDNAKITPRLKSTSSACGAPATGWKWNFLPGGMPGSHSGETPPQIMYSTPGIYTISVETTNGCGTTTATRTFTVYESPTVPAGVSITTPRCKGQTITFSNPNPGTLKYSWNGPAGFMSTKAVPDPITAVTIANGGPYFVTVTDMVSGCTGTKIFNVVVYDSPPVSIAPSPAATCINTPITLTANSPATITKYAWSPTTNMNPPAGNTKSVTVTPTSLTALTYTVTVTDNNGCTNTASITVTVNPKPTVNIPALSKPPCASTNTTLIGIGLPAGGMGWWTSNTPNIISQAGVLNAPAGSYMITFHYKAATGCEDSTKTTLCVISKPAASFTANTTGCAPLTVTTTNTSNAKDDCIKPTYNWGVKFNGSECDPNSMGQWSPTSSTAEAPVFIFQKTGVYELTLTVTNDCGTSTSTKTTITVAGPPLVDIMPLSDQCKLLPNNAIAPMAAVKNCYSPLTAMPYNWQFANGNPTSSTMLSPGTVTYTTTGNQIVTFSVSNGCGTTTDRDTFRIVDLPTVTLVYNNSPALCAGSNLVLTATATPAGLSYKWAGPSGTLTNTGSSVTINNAQAVHAGTYTVTVTLPGSALPCTATATVTVVVNPLPTVTVTPNAAAYCTGGSATLMASGADTYTWTPATTPPTGSTVTVNPAVTTTYTVTGTTTATGCKNTATATVTVHPIIKPSITTPLPIVACANTDKPLTAMPTSGGTGTWKSSSGSSITPAGVFKAPPGSYTVTYIFATNTTPACVDSAKVSICVVSPPVADFTIDKNFGCNSLTVTITNKTTAAADCKAPTYAWSVKFNGAECEPGSMGQVSPNSSAAKDPIFIFSKQGEYDLTLNVSNECGSNSKTVKVTVGGPPQVVCAPVNNLCKQLINTIAPTAMVKDCNSAVTAFKWSFPTADNFQMSTQLVPGGVNYTTEGLHTITFSATNACGTSTCTQSFTIQPLPTPTATANTPRCVGDKLDLGVTLPPGTYGYSWAGPAGFTSTSATPSRNPVQLNQAGVYTVTVTLAGCTAIATVDVQVNPLPVATATAAPNPICYGQSTTLTAGPTGMTTYAWSPATDLSNPNIFNPTSKPVVTPLPTATFTRTYTVAVTDGNGCKNTASTTFPVNPLPTVSITPPPLLCNQNIGQQLIFSPSTGGMGTWKGQHVSQTGLFTPTGLPGGAGDFPVTYIFKNQNGCIDSATVVVKVEDPVPIVMPADVSVCINSGKFTLSATPTPGTWSSAPASMLNPTTGEFTPSGDGVFTLTYTVGSGTCKREGTIKVTVWKLPAATATAAPNPICYGQSTTLTAGPAGMTTYAWSPVTDLSNPNIFNPTSKPVVTPLPTATFTRTYTVTVTDGNGCKNTAPTTFTVNPLPTVSITPPPLLCNQNIGQQLIFSPSTGGMGTWKGQHVSQTGLFTPTGLPGGAGDFPVTYIFKNQNGCIDSAMVVVKVEDPVPIVMPADVSVCINSGKFTLSATPTPGTWSGAPASMLNPATGEFTPSGDGVFTLTYTVGSGTCKREGTIKVTVWKLPTITVAGKPEICIGDLIPLTASGAVSYIWSPGTGLSTTLGSMVQANPTTTQTYTIVGTDANGCNNVTTFTLKVNPLPDVVAPDDIQLCNQAIAKDLSKLPKLKPLTGGVWSPTNSTSFDLKADGKFTPTGTPAGLGTFEVIYTYTDPVTTCTDRDTMKVTVVAPQDITMPKDAAVCIKSGKFTLSAQPSGGTWSSTPLSLVNPTTGEFDPSTEGTYILTYGIGEETCKKTATMVIIVNPLPKPQAAGDNKICLNDSTTITVTGNPANLATYAWSPATGLSATDKSVVKASPAGTTTYTITVTDTNGCVNTTTFTLTIDPLPMVNAGLDQSLCNQKIGEQLFGTPVPGAGEMGVWSGSPLLSVTGVFTPTGQPGGTGTYPVMYTFTDKNGCKASDEAIVTVDDPKILKLSKDTAVCINSALLQLSAEPIGGSWSQLWTGGSTLSGDGRFNPTKDGTYRAVYTFGDKSCLRKDTVIIIVNPLPVPAVGGDNKICFNDSTTITVTGNPANLSTYAWSPATGLSAVDKATVKASPAATTTYTVTVADTNGCVNTTTFTLTIDPLPIVSAGPDSVLCNQKIGAQLLGSPVPGAGATGLWSGTPLVSMTGLFTPTGPPGGTGTYPVTYTFTDKNGCKASDEAIVTVKDPEILTLPKDTAVCINSGVLTLVAQPGGGTWSGSASVTPGGDFDPTTASDYMLTYTFSSGTCLRTATMKIKVHPLPNVQIVGDNVLCFGDTTTLTASGAATYVWSPNTDISAATGAVVKAYPTTSPFAYTVVGTDANKCENSASINILVNPLPMADAGKMVTVCNQPIGEQLFGSPTTGGTGDWSGPHISKTGLFTPNGLGDFKVCYTFTDLNGCVDSACTMVKVEEPKTLVLPKDKAVCINSGILDLAPETTPTGGEWTYSPNPALVTPEGKFTPSEAGDYVLTYTFGSGTCLRVATMKIKVYPLPNVQIVGDNVLCFGDTTTLTASGAATYVWSPNTDISSVTGAVVKAWPTTSPFAYTVVGTDANKCENSASINILVNPLPMADAGKMVTVCNQPIGEQLFGSPTTGGTGDWSGPHISKTGLFTPNGLGDFKVCYTFTDLNGCVDSACTMVKVEEPKTLVLPKDKAVCINSGILDLAPETTPTGGEWTCSPNPALVTPEGKFTPSEAGDYVLTYTFGSGTCLRTATMKIKVNALPVPVTAGDNKICRNDSTTISVTPADLSVYAWGPSVGLSATDKASIKASPQASTIYTVTVTDKNGCVDTATFALTIDTLPIASAGLPVTVCNQPIGEPLTGSPTANGMGMWYGPNISQSGVFTPTGTPAGLGNFTVCYKFEDLNGCKDTACTVVTVKEPDTLVLPKDLAVCINSGVLDLAPETTPTGGEWTCSPNPALVTPEGKFTPSEAGDYVLTYTFGSGTCLRTATMKIKVNPLPTPAVASKTICFRESAMLVATPGNMVSYLWSPPLYLNVVNNDTVICTPTVKDGAAYTQAYSVVVTDANGCVNTATATVLVNPLPTVEAGPATTYCDNPNPMNIQLAPATPPGGVWSGPGIVNPMQGLFNTAVAGGPGLYTLFYTYTIAATGCTDLDSVFITVVPPIQAVVPPFDTTCYTSGLTTLVGTPANGTWSGPGIIDPKGVFDPKEAAVIKSTPPTTIYELVYSYGKDDCETKDTLQMLVVNYIGVMDAGKDFALCDSTPAFNLVGQPVGGYWVGPGITNSINGTFYSAEAKPGIHQLIYFYRDPVADCLWSDTVIATVHPLPGAGFKKIEEGCITKPIQFENTTTNAVKYYWTFGDGGFSEEKDPQHAYTQVGTYTITLVATTDKGCQDSVKQTIIVAEPPYAAFTPSTNEGCAELLVNFTNESSGYKISYFWDFGNGDTSTLRIPPSVLYQQGMHDTTYYVQLNVTNICGTRYELDSILVHPKPVMQFGTNVDEGCSPLTVEFANISYGDPKSFIWDLGNGVISYDSIPPPQTYFTDSVDRVYTIRLIGINECGRDTFTKIITVLPNHLNAFFNTDPTVGCEPLKVTFKNFSSGQNMVYNWIFGDKTPDSVEKDPIHTFEEAGVFKVILRVSNGCGYDTAFTYVTVYPQPKAVFSHLPKACEDAPVQFTNNSTGTLGSHWDFGDGDTSALKDPLHEFKLPGKYTIKLTVYAEITGCPATDSSVIEIAERPVAAFSHAPDACVPASIQMENKSTGADYYAWTFGNGTVSSQASPMAIYKKDGTFQICLVAFDNEGCMSDPLCSPIIIHPKPKSAFSIANNDPCGLPLEVQLNNLSTGANGYDWRLGNGNTSTETNPTAVYSDSGMYKITLIVENQFKCRDTSAQSIRALYDPVADFEWSPEDGCQPLVVNFDTISGYFNQVWWDFGDGSKSTAFTPTHVYKDTGYYQVRLRVGSYGICFDEIIRDSIIRVYPTPVAKFTFSEPIDPTPPDGTVLFKNESSKDAHLFKWAFGDGDSSILENPTHRYFHNWVDNMIPLKDIAILWVENDYGCLDSFALPVMHIPIKGLFVPNAFSPETGVQEVRIFQPAGVGLKKYRIEIFSSWGELLWVSDKLTADGRPEEAWDGMYKGRLMPQDVYVWKVEAEFEDGNNWNGMENRRGKLRRTGTVTLLR